MHKYLIQFIFIFKINLFRKFKKKKFIFFFGIIFKLKKSDILLKENEIFLFGIKMLYFEEKKIT